MKELIEEVYDIVKIELDGMESESVLEAFTLLGNLSKENITRLDTESALVEVLQDAFENGHEIWDYVEIEE